MMLFHGPKVLALARRHANLVTKAKSWHAHAFHSSVQCRKQYLDANEKTFNQVLLNEGASDRIVLVDFYAEFVTAISPILERLAAETSNFKTRSGRSLDLVTVDTDKQTELAAKHKIRSLPTVMAFKDGKLINHFIGALRENDVKKFVQQL